MSWRDGWPIPGRVGEPETQDSEDWTQGLAGVNSIRPVPAGSMLWQCPVPPVRGTFPAVFPQESEGFSARRGLSPAWLWNHAPTAGAFSLSAREGWLRLFAVCRCEESSPFFRTPNVLGRRFTAAPKVTVQVRLDPAGLLPGQEAGLVHFNGGRAYTSLTVFRREDGSLMLRQDDAGTAPLSGDSPLMLQSVVTEGVNRFFFREGPDGAWTPLGDARRLTPGGFRGDFAGLFTRTFGEPGGYADFADFRYDGRA